MKSESQKLLLIIAGPTAVGKTSFAIDLARYFKTEIISSDSRQFFKELSIGTAKPTNGELRTIPHHFIGNLSIHDNYNISSYEHEVLAKLDELFKTKDIVIMVGGSGLYIDAVCYGIDDFPNVDEKLRSQLKSDFEELGLDYLISKLKKLDPEYLEIVDKQNPNRIIRALEVCIITGKKYSEQRRSPHKKRPFKVLKFALNRDRANLFERIALRVDQMHKDGLIEEVESLKAYKKFNALNTVGYKEIFSYLNEEMSLELALEKIKTNTRRYAKRQLTWLKRDGQYQWITPNDLTIIIEKVDSYFEQ